MVIEELGGRSGQGWDSDQTILNHWSGRHVVQPWPCTLNEVHPWPCEAALGCHWDVLAEHHIVHSRFFIIYLLQKWKIPFGRIEKSTLCKRGNTSEWLWWRHRRVLAVSVSWQLEVGGLRIQQWCDDTMLEIINKSRRQFIQTIHETHRFFAGANA